MCRQERYFAVDSMKELLEAAFTSRHQTSAPTPQMKEYFLAPERNGHLTYRSSEDSQILQDALMRYVGEMAAPGQDRLLGGHQAPREQEAISEVEALRSASILRQPTLAGRICLTHMANVPEIHKRLKEPGRPWPPKATWDGRPQEEEVIRLERERKHLNQNLSGPLRT